MIRLRIRVEGKVQDVYYRASTQSKAQELGLSGWVKNQPDGSVLLEVQGPFEVVNKLVDWCQKGPIMAKVIGLTKEEIPVINEQDFLLLY
jgi:acylphosphatase